MCRAPRRRPGPVFGAPQALAARWSGAMSLRSHVPCFAGATWAIVLAAASGAAAAGPPAGPAAMPDAADVVRAWQAARRWVDTFQVPDPGDPAARASIGGGHGVCLVLRQSGRLVAIATDTSGGDGGDLMLRRAAARALGQALADPAVAALPREMLHAAGSALTMELEVAGRPLPLVAGSEGEVAEQLDPGLDGVAMRRGDTLAMLFPAQMRAGNSPGRVERLLPALAPDLGLAVLPLPDLARRFDVSIYRFPVTTLVQSSPSGAPFPIVRGEILVTEAQVTPQSLARAAIDLAAHLGASMAPMDEALGLMGTYRPTADRYEPLIAPPFDQALAAWALAHCARVPGIDAAARGRMMAVAREIVTELDVVAAAEDDPLADRGACAAIVLAGLGLPGYVDGAEPPRIFSEAARRVAAGVADGGETLSPNGRALAAWALARLAAWGKAGVSVPAVRAAIDGAWSSVPPHQQATLLPWIAWAEADYAADTRGTLDHADDLARLRDLLEASRIGEAGPAELAGGLRLAEGNRLVATAQAFRPAAFLAWSVRKPGLTPPADAPAALGRSLATARFLMQLSVRADSTWAYANPERALGGVRAALFDSDQPVAAQAMALATLSETLLSLDHVAAQPPR